MHILLVLVAVSVRLTFSYVFYEVLCKFLESSGYVFMDYYLYFTCITRT